MLRRNAVPELPMTWRTITGTGQRRPGERLPPAYAAAERGRLPPRRLYQPLAYSRGQPPAARAMRFMRKGRNAKCRGCSLWDRSRNAGQPGAFVPYPGVDHILRSTP